MHYSMENPMGESSLRHAAMVIRWYVCKYARIVGGFISNPRLLANRLLSKRHSDEQLNIFFKNQFSLNGRLPQVISFTPEEIEEQRRLKRYQDAMWEKWLRNQK